MNGQHCMTAAMPQRVNDTEGAGRNARVDQCPPLGKNVFLAIAPVDVDRPDIDDLVAYRLDAAVDAPVDVSSLLLKAAE